MKTLMLAAAAGMAIASAQAHAAPTIFAVNGTFQNGTTLSGTLDVDTTLGAVTGSTLTNGSTTFTFLDTTDSMYSSTFGGYGEYIGSSAAMSQYLALLFPVKSLVGYAGGTLYTSGFKSSTGYYSGLQPAGIGLTSVTLAAVPEPGTWALMLTGFGAIGVALRRRRSVRVCYAA